MKSPIVPPREAKQRESSQGAKRNLTDGWRIKAAFNRREAEKGFGDESPSGVWGGNPMVTPSPSSSPPVTSMDCNELLS